MNATEGAIKFDRRRDELAPVRRMDFSPRRASGHSRLKADVVVEQF
jgi:hypothetical protein